MARTYISKDEFISDKDGDSPNRQTVYVDKGSFGQCDKLPGHYNPETEKKTS